MWVAYLLLWFAFILLSLSYWKQLVRFENVESGGCDLLSFYYLCRTGNNSLWSNQMSNSLWFAFILLSLSYWKQRFIIFPVLELVVICFHFTIFVVLETTLYNFPCLRISCDLLSFYYLCRTGNNSRLKPHNPACVVICFHFTIFVVLETTVTLVVAGYRGLWFAFILLSLSYWKQPVLTTSVAQECCDLLSFYYLCRTGNNGSIRD